MRKCLGIAILIWLAASGCAQTGGGTGDAAGIASRGLVVGAAPQSPGAAGQDLGAGGTVSNATGTTATGDSEGSGEESGPGAGPRGEPRDNPPMAGPGTCRGGLLNDPGCPIRLVAYDREVKCDGALVETVRTSFRTGGPFPLGRPGELASLTLYLDTPFQATISPEDADLTQEGYQILTDSEGHVHFDVTVTAQSNELPDSGHSSYYRAAVRGTEHPAVGGDLTPKLCRGAQLSVQGPAPQPSGADSQSRRRLQLSQPRAAEVPTDGSAVQSITPPVEHFYLDLDLEER